MGKAGVRGFPRLEPAQALLMEVLQNPPLPLEGPLLDLTAMSGISGVMFKDQEPTLVERSRAALNVLERQGLGKVTRGLPSQLEGEYGTVLATLPADRGNDAVDEVVRAAFRLTKPGATGPGGTCYLAGDKDRGFERYFKWAREHFGEGEILERHKGLRVAGFRKTRAEVLEPTLEPILKFGEYEFESLKIATLPGVFSAKGVDAATKLLLEFLAQHLPEIKGQRVLDIGAGAGVMGSWAASRGAKVTMLEDDWGGVLCSKRTLERSGLSGEVLHSDAGSALPSSGSASAQFDTVLSNPPFHVGSDLILEVAEEFIALAARVLPKGGNFYLVANVFLAYEPLLERFFKLSTSVRNRSFKVLCGQKR
jgi:16S rRNA (guanine1207-N2)-methyltransferase